MEGAISLPRNTRIAVVTGANRGIGLEVCRQLAGNGVTVVLTAVDEELGAKAVGNLQGLALSDVLSHQLDITDASSIARLANFLKARFGKLDILVNNAAVAGVVYSQDHLDDLEPREEKFNLMDRDQRLEWLWRNCRETYHAAKECLQTNYYGTKHVIEALLPLLKASDDGRIVNISSDFGNEDLKQVLNDVGNLTEERLDELLDQFLRDFKVGTAEARGWPVAFAAYKVSKAAVNAYSRMLAAKQPALRVNCAHPGYVKTDITLHSGLLAPEEGASNVVKVALLPDGGVTGAFFEEGNELASFV
uniref:(+)-neomenthol dehydrogenase n=1 Tax=Zea mays TaxID=4577 RepID=A0A804MCQ3_MAIZE